MWIIFFLLFPSFLWAAERVLVREVALVKAVRSADAMGPEITIPKDAQGTMRIALDLDKADLENPAVEARIELWVHTGIFYEPRYAARYKGGNYIRDGVAVTDPPGFWIDTAKFAGKKIRIRVIPLRGRTMNVGATTEK